MGDTNTLRDSVLAALTRVVHPSSGENIVTSGTVQDFTMTDGDVRFAFLLRAEDPGSLVKDARVAASSVEGVAAVKIDVRLPQAAPEAAPSRGAPPHDHSPGGHAPGRGGGLRPGSVPAPTPKPGLLPGVKRIIAVSSGKGGVGKSMIATNLAAGLTKGGRSVGLLDADIYGPNIPLMFGEERRPTVSGGKGQEMIEPLEAHGVRLMSLGFLLEREQPAIMRGPLIAGILKQFLEQVAWGRLDVMVVDMPPGTGDAQLSLVQTIDLHGVVMVTTPQDVAVGDVRRGIKMFERVNTRLLGIVENMSGYACPHCHEVVDIFGAGGGARLSEEADIPLLGSVPLDSEVRSQGDRGQPTVLSSPGSPAAAALRGICDILATELFS